ncbi:hypothetical protein RCL1_002559 [Eukaryota sp. TZLM3-RCL]
MLFLKCFLFLSLLRSVCADEFSDIALEVKESFRRAYIHYMNSAYPFDELKPLSNKGQSMFDLPLSTIDSIDTMFIMQHYDLLAEAKTIIKEHLSVPLNKSISVFEFNIRILGSLISIYDLTFDPFYLEKALQFGELLLRALHPSSSDFPLSSFNLKTLKGNYHSWTYGNAVLSELGTLSLEFIALSARSGDPRFQRAVDSIMKKLAFVREVEISRKSPSSELFRRGLFSSFLSKSVHLGSGNLAFSLNGLSDSYYEYIFKNSILTKGNLNWISLSSLTLTGILDFLLHSTANGTVYLSENNADFTNTKMEHLACFFPATLIKFVQSFKLDNSFRNFLMKISLDLTRTCMSFYDFGYSPDAIEFNSAPDLFKLKRFYSSDWFSSVPSSRPAKIISHKFSPVAFTSSEWTAVDTKHLLRPEVIESVYFAFCETNSDDYLKFGVKFWQNISKLQTSLGGFHCLNDFKSFDNIDDWQPSWFLAETFKYLYLLLTRDLNYCKNFVFNTEAHPIRPLKTNHFD